MREGLRKRRGIVQETSWPLLGLFKPWLQNELRHKFICLKGVRGYSIAGRVLVTVWLLFAFVFLKPRIAGVESWRLPQHFFPQIDFSRPRIDDPIRALVQLFWLMFIRPHSARRSVKKTVGTA
ncbi:MAG: cellulose synthase (UDP-forming), partial [Zhongshania marina]